VLQGLLSFAPFPHLNQVIQGVQSNMEHMTQQSHRPLNVLIVIDVKLQKETVQIKITEDPQAAQRLNFYDIQKQIVYQLNKYKSQFDESSRKEGDTKQAPSILNNDLVEAFEFKVKRELQIKNMEKYQSIAMNTQLIQQMQNNHNI
jgi:hypothetical protein